MKRIIAVFGTGRSGTSLAMQSLVSAGVDVSADTVPASNNNLRGAFEDQQLFTLQQQFIQAQFRSDGLRPNDWQTTDAYVGLKKSLARIVKEKTQGDDKNAWAIKLPQISLVLPLWLNVFDELGADYRLVFCVRGLDATLKSFLLAYDNETLQTAQRIVLLRSYYAARDLRSRGFLLGYETWFGDATRTKRELLEYCGLSVPDGVSQPDTNYQPELNRGNADTSLPGEPLTIVRELSDAIGGLTCDHRHLDVEKLRPVLRELTRDLSRQRSTTLTALAGQQAQCGNDATEFWKTECRRRASEVGRLHFKTTAEMLAHDADRARLANDIEAQKREVAREKRKQSVRTNGTNKDTPRNRLALKIGLAVLDAYKKPLSDGLRLPARLFALHRDRREERKQKSSSSRSHT